MQQYDDMGFQRRCTPFECSSPKSPISNTVVILSTSKLQSRKNTKSKEREHNTSRSNTFTPICRSVTSPDFLAETEKPKTEMTESYSIQKKKDLGFQTLQNIGSEKIKLRKGNGEITKQKQ